MNKDIKVSVIIPIHNVEDYLAECLDSVLSQTLKDIEIICINDGSTDKSPEILEQYRNYKNIIIVHQKNQGVGATRNLGINMAKGQYCVFIDPDDFYPHNKILENLYSGIAKHKAKICGGNFAE